MGVRGSFCKKPFYLSFRVAEQFAPAPMFKLDIFKIFYQINNSRHMIVLIDYEFCMRLVAWMSYKLQSPQTYFIRNLRFICIGNCYFSSYAYFFIDKFALYSYSTNIKIVR